MSSFTKRVTGERAKLVETLFPTGVPRLWCPTLTHYDADVRLDKGRIKKHIQSLQPWVKGFLIPGSTGEGWEMTDAEILELLDVTIDGVKAVGGHILIGILKTDATQVLTAIKETRDWLKQRSGGTDTLEALKKSAVCGFTVCPPAGAELDQETISKALVSVLDLGVPVSLYQLPQVTSNEMSPQTVTALAARYPNFYLFKDTSGGDKVSVAGFNDAFLVRGAEGNYAPHLLEGGGTYDGFLLSTANCFGKQLFETIDAVARGDMKAAEPFSYTLSTLCTTVFDLAGKVGYGNAFTNANKAMDHFMAYGPKAVDVLPPMLHSGKRLPQDLIGAVGAQLERHGLMPKKGYLE